jgi:hypothetical protein
MHSIEQIRQVLRYDPVLGRFFWAAKRRGKQIGQQAGSFDAHGYGQIRIDGALYKEHRLVWAYVTGEWPTAQIDHINHDRRDNRFENLRLADNVENHRNRPMQRNNTTGIAGVSYDRGRYVAYINAGGRKHYLGRHASLEGAGQARADAMRRMGFHENHGTGVGISKPQAKLKQLKKDAA